MFLCFSSKRGISSKCDPLSICSISCQWLGPRMLTKDGSWVKILCRLLFEPGHPEYPGARERGGALRNPKKGQTGHFSREKKQQVGGGFIAGSLFCLWTKKPLCAKYFWKIFLWIVGRKVCCFFSSSKAPANKKIGMTGCFFKGGWFRKNSFRTCKKTSKEVTVPPIFWPSFDGGWPKAQELFPPFLKPSHFGASSIETQCSWVQKPGSGIFSAKKIIFKTQNRCVGLWLKFCQVVGVFFETSNACDDKAISFSNISRQFK